MDTGYSLTAVHEDNREPPANIEDLQNLKGPSRIIWIDISQELGERIIAALWPDFVVHCCK